jgi:hypothetical protein
VPSTMHLAVALQNATSPGSCDRLPRPRSVLSLHWHVEAQSNVLVGKLAVRQLRTKADKKGDRWATATHVLGSRERTKRSLVVAGR